MITPEEKAAYKKRLEEARDKKDMAEKTKSVEKASREEAMYRERRKRLEEASDRREANKPVQILHDDFLRQCIARFKFRPEEELVHFVNQWTNAALKYLRWLESEGFTRVKSVKILNAALERADFNLTKFPVCGQLYNAL